VRRQCSPEVLRLRLAGRPRCPPAALGGVLTDSRAAGQVWADRPKDAAERDSLTSSRYPWVVKGPH
jgi:hypothetical protein